MAPFIIQAVLVRFEDKTFYSTVAVLYFYSVCKGRHKCPIFCHSSTSISYFKYKVRTRLRALDAKVEYVI